MSRDADERTDAARASRDPDEAMDLAGTGPDAHSAQEVGLAPEDIPEARRSVARADREAEARQVRENRLSGKESPPVRPAGFGSDQPEAEGGRERIGWTGAPKRDERAESENALPPPEDVFHQDPGSMA